MLVALRRPVPGEFVTVSCTVKAHLDHLQYVPRNGKYPTSGSKLIHALQVNLVAAI